MNEKGTNSSKINIDDFLIKRFLTLEPLRRYWEETANEEENPNQSIAAQIIEKTKFTPELFQPIDNFDIIKKNQKLVDLMMTAIYPPASIDRMVAASVVPLEFTTFYSTPLFDKRVNFSEEGFIKHLGIPNWDAARIHKAYSIILFKCYGVKLRTGVKLVLNFPDRNNGLDKYFQIDFDMKFLDVKINGEKPDLTTEDIDLFMKNPEDLDFLLSKLPPEKFEMHGFFNLIATEVTNEEIISSLKHLLLESHSLSSNKNHSEIHHKIKSYFKSKEIKMGLAVLNDDKEIFRYGNKIGESFVMCENSNFQCSNYENSYYQKAAYKKSAIIIDDLTELEDRTVIEDYIVSLGIKNLAIIPLYNNDELIGFFELASPNKGDIGAIDHFKLKELETLFTIAVKRTQESNKNEIRNIINEKFTAIHPSVEWRFTKAAMNLINNRKSNKKAEMEPIVFDNVYPLYGVSDIRDSSNHRNDAIQSDLLQHLTLVKNILDKANDNLTLPILGEMGFRVSKYRENIKNHLNSGDEVSVLDFLNDEIEKLFGYLRNNDPDLKTLIDNYKSALDPNLHSVYLKRRDYESSVMLINETISAILDEAEFGAQKMFPHYFEKYKTDGVEHGIYIGAALTEEKEFDLLYLHNLRLWQLQTFCGIVREAEKIKPQLQVPLETAHLILVQHTPLSIRFRPDEKKFDVDGTYNIRYEIMKKRIDKASVRGTSERLTQPGKIAIVYSQMREANEYRRYIEFLQSKNYLLDEVEDLELDSMQGVRGLRALRVKVNLSNSSLKGIAKTKIKDMVENITSNIN